MGDIYSSKIAKFHIILPIAGMRFPVTFLLNSIDILSLIFSIRVLEYMQYVLVSICKKVCYLNLNGENF